MYNDTQHDYTWLSDVVESSACLEIVQRRHKTLNCNRGITHGHGHGHGQRSCRDWGARRGYVARLYGMSMGAEPRGLVDVSHVRF